MKKLILLIGVSGSGKTTLWEDIETDSIIRISADRYRHKLYDYNNSFIIDITNVSSFLAIKILKI